MVEFVDARGALGAITRIITESRGHLTLLCPYNRPAADIRDRLIHAAQRGIAITLVFGKTAMDERQRGWLQELPNCRLLFSERLHAKCYYNDREMVITSLNLLESSEQNWEMGVRVSADDAVYQVAIQEAKQIIAMAKPVPRGPAIAAKSVERSAPDNGSCIRCGDSIRREKERPFCLPCYDEWAQWGNWEYTERYCHYCRRSAKTTRAHPLCSSCKPSIARFFGLRI